MHQADADRAENQHRSIDHKRYRSGSLGVVGRRDESEAARWERAQRALAGVEAKLVSFLNDTSAPATENSWFDFDRLLFDTGKASLQPALREQLKNIADILRAYPQVKVRIGGYTDNTGDPAASLQLSQQRADNVLAKLTRLGADPSRIQVGGLIASRINTEV